MLLHGAIHERQFPDWSMRVEIIAGAQPGVEPPGEIVKALRAQSRLAATPTPAHALLMTFAGWGRHAGELARTRDTGSLAGPDERHRPG